jgi:hypothetical protein
LRTYKVPELVLLVLERVDVYAFLVEERRAHLELREDRGDEGGLGGGGSCCGWKGEEVLVELAGLGLLDEEEQGAARRAKERIMLERSMQ